MWSTNNYYSETVFSNLRSATTSEKIVSGDSNEENVPFFLWPKHLPWRLFRTTYGYHRNERACRFAAIPKIHITPITKAILTKSKATLELCCCLVTCLALWNNQNVNNPGFKIQICLRCCVGHASRRTNSWIGKAQTDRQTVGFRCPLFK